MRANPAGLQRPNSMLFALSKSEPVKSEPEASGTANLCEILHLSENSSVGAVSLCG